MNCETCQELIHDLVDGSITQRDEFTLNTHLRECLDCESVRQDLESIVGFCRTQRAIGFESKVIYFGVTPRFFGAGVILSNRGWVCSFLLSF